MQKVHRRRGQQMQTVHRRRGQLQKRHARFMRARMHVFRSHELKLGCDGLHLRSACRADVLSHPALVHQLRDLIMIDTTCQCLDSYAYTPKVEYSVIVVHAYCEERMSKRVQWGWVRGALCVLQADDMDLAALFMDSPVDEDERRRREEIDEDIHGYLSYILCRIYTHSLQIVHDRYNHMAEPLCDAGGRVDHTLSARMCIATPAT